MKRVLSKICDIIGQILAVVLVIVLLVLLLNANLGGFLQRVPVLFNIFKGIFYYGSLLLIGVVGLEAMIKRKLVFLILFLVVLAVVIIFMFFPGTFRNFINFIKG